MVASCGENGKWSFLVKNMENCRFLFTYLRDVNTGESLGEFGKKPLGCGSGSLSIVFHDFLMRFCHFSSVFLFSNNALGNRTIITGSPFM